MTVKMDRMIGCFIWFLFVTEVTMVSNINRVVFQTFILSDGTTVQCYGRCQKDPTDLSGQLKKFNVTSCEGTKVRLNCPTDRVINIHAATSGRLDPDLEICNQNQPLFCSKDITSKLQNNCEQGRQCTISVSTYDFTEQCEEDEYLAFDVQYSCELPAKKTPTKPESERTQRLTPTQSSDQSLKSTGGLHPSTFTKLFITEPTVADTTMTSKREAQRTHGFWIMTAYSLLSDSEFIKRNKMHLIFAVILAIFLGLVLSLCFMLDHCRRARLRKAKRMRQKASEDEQEFLENEELYDGDNNNIIMERLSNMEQAPLQNGGKLTREMCRYYTVITPSHNSPYNLNENVAALFPLDINNVKHNQKIHLKMKSNDLIQQNDFRVQSPSSLPPPPEEFLNTSPLSSSNELIPPPAQFNEKSIKAPQLIITSPTLTNSTTNSQPTIATSRCESRNNTPEKKSTVDVRPILSRSQSNSNSICSGNQTTLGYPGSVQIQRKFLDYHVIKPPRSTQLQRKCSYLNDYKTNSEDVELALKRKSISDETLGDLQLLDIINNGVSKPFRVKPIRNKPFESPIFRTNGIADNRNGCKTDSNVSPPFIRHPKKGRLHVIQSPYVKNTKKCLGNGELKPSMSVPKYLSDFGRNDKEGNCTRASVQSDINFACSKPNETNCMDKLPCNLCSLENHKSEDAEVVSAADTNFDSRVYIVHESGYQSHETGTDSLCSSTRSTDQEDCQMFSPASSGSSKQIGSRTKVNRTRNARRDPKLLPLSTQISLPVNTIRRLQHDGRFGTDILPYESSFDDASSRDSVQMITRNKPKSKKRENSFNIKNGMIPDRDVNLSGVSHVGNKKGILKNGYIDSSFEM